MKRLPARADPIMTMGFQLSLGSIPLGLASGVTEDPFSLVRSARFVVILGALAIFGTALAY